VQHLTAHEFEDLADRLVSSAGKLPYIATAQLCDVYRDLDEQSQAAVDEVLSRWITGENAGRRFDATVLIREFRIRSALPALDREIARRSGAVDGPDFFDRRQLEEVAAELRAG
jgi:hypothetical protein